MDIAALLGKLDHVSNQLLSDERHDPAVVWQYGADLQQVAYDIRAGKYGENVPETLAYIVSDFETREQIDPPTVIGARAEFYDVDHYGRAHEDTAEHPASLLFLGWDKSRPVKVYKVVADQ